MVRPSLLALALVAGATACGGDSGGDARPNAFVAVRAQDNPTIPSSGDAFTEVVRLPLESGRYEVTGKVELHNRDAAAPFVVQCNLVPSRPDGTPGDPGELGSDSGFIHLERSSEPGDQGAIVLFVSQELSQSGSVVLGCSGYGNEHGAFAAYASVRAIEVASITTANVTP